MCKVQYSAQVAAVPYAMVAAAAAAQQPPAYLPHPHPAVSTAYHMPTTDYILLHILSSSDLDGTCGDERRIETFTSYEFGDLYSLSVLRHLSIASGISISLYFLMRKFASEAACKCVCLLLLRAERLDGFGRVV